MRTLPAVVAAVALHCTLGAALAQRISDEELDRRLQHQSAAFWRQQQALQREGKALTREEHERMTAEALAGIDLDSLTPEQLFRVVNTIPVFTGELRKQALALLDEARKEQGSSGAVAAMGYAILLQGPTEEHVAARRAALRHAGMREALRTRDAVKFPPMVVLNQDPGVVEALADELVALLRMEPGLTFLTTLDSLVDAVERSEMDPARKEEFREAALAAIRACRARLDHTDDVRVHYAASGVVGPPREGALDTTRAYAASRLQLIERRLQRSFEQRAVGQSAPALELRWVCGGREGTGQVADLKGRVVVLVSWYRWPGPPGLTTGEGLLRSLAERYNDRPVEVVAHTVFLRGSLHGWGGLVDPGGSHDQQRRDITRSTEAAGIRGPVAVISERERISNYGSATGVIVIDAAGVLRAVLPNGSAEQAVFDAVDEALKAAPAGEPQPSPKP